MLKKIFVLAILAFSVKGAAHAQVVNFEDLTLPADSFWNGSDFSGGFSSGNSDPIFFPNNFMDYGGGFTYWDGFSYSNILDDTTQAYINQFGCYAGNMLAGSQIFGVSYNGMDYINYNTIPTDLNFLSVLSAPQYIYLTNSSYTALTIKNGDGFCKKFGGVSGDDPDWFKLDIIGSLQNVITDTVHFYLADYRFLDNQNDYILKNWTQVDLTPLGIVDRIQFLLRSSDTGSYGMNTPAFFCFDDFNPNFFVNIDENKLTDIQLCPNPTNGVVYCNDIISSLKIFTVEGKEIFSKSELLKSFDISEIPAGIYFVHLKYQGKESIQKLIKK